MQCYYNPYSFVHYLILGNRLNMVEDDLNRVNLTGRIDSFRNLRNIQKKRIDKYERELADLEYEVNNIAEIATALPDNCFLRNRLEP